MGLAAGDFAGEVVAAGDGDVAGVVAAGEEAPPPAGVVVVASGVSAPSPQAPRAAAKVRTKAKLKNFLFITLSHADHPILKWMEEAFPPN
ncbi:MAG: hypothetical protein KME19_09835 [Microcoleus vaginatus WJT46-NPBG5]|nr:hypothetical protein [Microcoleus vaginatus WJT46-NPBG5]